MLQDFVIIQRKAIEDDFVCQDSCDSSSWFQFKTCLRNMLLGPRDEISQWQIQAGDEVREGEEAYTYFLEVVCGLHSSLIGETEILGQFKNAVLKFDFPNSHFGIELKKFFQAMIEDVKKVRSQHLSDLGSQSYGSLLRKDARALNETEFHILGAGHLCEEILPWIAKDGASIHLHVRNLEGAKAKFKSPALQWHDLQRSENTRGILVIAAPLSSVEIEKLLTTGLKRIYDLRHNSETDPIRCPCEIKTLTQVMSELSENAELIRDRKELAVKMIDQMTQLRNQRVEHRPFGWEDMTA